MNSNSSKTDGAGQALVELGFTPLEAEVYALLLDEAAITGYRIAQSLRKPAPNVYKAIESLESKGAVMVDDGKRRVCRAVPPQEVLANLERRFKRATERASTSLGHRDRRAPDQRVYRLSSPEAVLERARTMLAAASEVAILDAFPGPVEQLEGELSSAASRGAFVAVKAYAARAIPGVNVVLAARAASTRERWPGDWLNLVVDGGECLIALLTAGGTGVHQAIWSRSPYLSYVYHSALASEIMLDAVEAGIAAADDNATLRGKLRALQPMRGLRAPGYRQLLSEIVESESP